jgi:type VI secretion system protein ImpA
MHIQALLAPIEPDAPCGADLSFSTEFDRIVEMRREDDPTLQQGEWVTALKVADWPGVVEMCETLLRERTKDLRVVGWLTEALARSAGYAGLADGLSVAALLCERFWDQVHPQPDDGDMEQRIGNLGWLLTSVQQQAQRLPVLVEGDARFSLADIEAARTQSPDLVTRARRATPRDWLARNVEDVQRAIEALHELQRVVDDKLGADGPGFVAARRVLEDAAHEVQRLAREGGVAAPGAADAAAPGAAAGSTGAAAAGTGGPLHTRAQALQSLREVAEYFRRTEPHSPVAYLADKAARWGEMPLHVWLRAVMKDAGALSHVEELLGVEPPAEGGTT